MENSSPPTNGVTKKSFLFQQGKGYRLYSVVIDTQTSSYVFANTTIEICYFAFENHAKDLISKYGVNSTRLITDTLARKELGISDNVLRRNGNSRESKLLKKSGKTSMYVSKYIRDYIRRNRDIFNILSDFYANNKLAFTNSLDYLIYKPVMSEKSLPILDCHIFEPLQAATSVVNPFHYVCFVCVSSNSSDVNKPLPVNHHKITADNDMDGSIYLLENFDVHFEDIKDIIRPSGKYPINKQKKNIEVSLLENLDINGINDELRRIHESKFDYPKFKKRSTDGFNFTTESLPSGPNRPDYEFKPLEWKKVEMKPGDLLVFDCRIPYMTAANKAIMWNGEILNNNPVVFIPVSLRPVGKDWYSSQKYKELTEAIKTGKAGNWGKRTYKGCNMDEFRWRSTERSLPGSTIGECVDIKDFLPHDRLIFGLDKYTL